MQLNILGKMGAILEKKGKIIEEGKTRKEYVGLNWNLKYWY